MRESLKEEIRKWHNKGLSIYGIEAKLQHKIKSWQIKEILEQEIKEDHNSMF